MFQGLSRYVLNHIRFDKSDSIASVPVKRALNTGNITKPLQGAGTKEVDHQDIAEIPLHLILSSDYNTHRYEWGSTELMLRAFCKMFLVTKTHIQCFFKARENLGLDRLYGQLFALCFHNVVMERGYI